MQKSIARRKTSCRSFHTSLKISATLQFVSLFCTALFKPDPDPKFQTCHLTRKEVVGQIMYVYGDALMPPIILAQWQFSSLTPKDLFLTFCTVK
jgi:hypothetical protein